MNSYSMTKFDEDFEYPRTQVKSHRNRVRPGPAGRHQHDKPKGDPYDDQSESIKTPSSRMDRNTSNDQRIKANKPNKLPTWTFESRILDNDWCKINDALIYSYMLARCRWFREHNKVYFESQERIAAALHLSLSTVKRSIALLVKHGYILIERIKADQYKKNQYFVIELHGTYEHLKHNPRRGNSGIAAEHSSAHSKHKDTAKQWNDDEDDDVNEPDF